MNQNTKKIIKILVISIFFIFIFIYALFISKDLIFGVKIKNVNLVDGSLVAESILKVTGNSKNAVKLALDGREISVDEQGDFEETIALLPGYNIINIRAQDKFGYVDEKNYKLMYIQ